MILYIDTKDQKMIVVSLREGDKVIEEMSEENGYGSQVLLPLIIKLLRSYTPGVASHFHSRSESSGNRLEGIEVESGPGSFTGLKVGASVAQALGFALKIPVNGKSNTPVELKYT